MQQIYGSQSLISGRQEIVQASEPLLHVCTFHVRAAKQQTANTAKHAICECLFSFKAVVIDVGLAELFPPSEADSFSSRALNDIASRVSFS